MKRKGEYKRLILDHAAEVLDEPRSERLRRWRERQQREAEEREAQRWAMDGDRVDHLTPAGFLDLTKDPLPQGPLTPHQHRLWRHVLEGVAYTVLGQSGHQLAAQPREEPFAGVGHALAALVFFRVDGPPIKSLSDPDRFEAIRAPQASPGGDVAQRLAEHLDPVERAWRAAYDGPWDSGVVSERDCRLWLLLRYVSRWGPQAIDERVHLEPYGMTVGTRLIGRVTRYGHGRVLEYLADRDLVPFRREATQETESMIAAETDLEGWKAIGDVLGVHEATARKYAREGMPVYRFGRRVEAVKAEILEWKAERMEPYGGEAA